MELHNFRIHLPTKLTPDQGTVEYVSSPFNSSSSSPSNIVFPDQEGKTNKTVSLLQNVADTNTPIERVSSIHEYSELHFKNFTGVIRLEHITPLKTSFEVPSSAVNIHKTVGKSGSISVVTNTTKNEGITTPQQPPSSSAAASAVSVVGNNHNNPSSSTSSSSSSVGTLSGLSQPTVNTSHASSLDTSTTTEEPVQPTPRTNIGKRKSEKLDSNPTSSSSISLVSPSSPTDDDTSITFDAQSAMNQALSMFGGMNNNKTNDPVSLIGGTPGEEIFIENGNSITSTTITSTTAGGRGQSKRSKPSTTTEGNESILTDPSVSITTVNDDPATSVAPKARKSRGSQKTSSSTVGVLDFETTSRRSTASGSSSSSSSSGSVSQFISPHPPEIEQAYMNLISTSSSSSNTSTKMLSGCKVVVPSSSSSSSSSSMVRTQAPTGRWGHAAAPLDSTHILVNGGEVTDNDIQADSYILDVVNGGTWKKEPQDLDAVPRVFHSLVHIPEKGWTVAFGGNNNGGSSTAATTEEGTLSSNTATGTEELSVFDPNISLWYTPKAVGKFPSKRSGHSMTLVPKCKLPQTSAASRDAEPMLLIFGGLRDKGNQRYTWLNDLYVCEMPKGMQWLKWHHIATTEGRAPMPRCYHSAAGVGNKLVVFGGNSNLQTYEDVTYLLCEPTRSAPDTWSWHQPVIHGKGPGPRTNATSTAIGDRFILITGGWNTDEMDDDNEETTTGLNTTTTTGSNSNQHLPGKPYPDPWLLDTERWEWVQLQINNDNNNNNNDLARAGHTAVYMDDVSGLLPVAMINDYTASTRSPTTTTISSSSSSPVTTVGLYTTNNTYSSSSTIPGIVFIGGKKADDQRYADIVVLVLPAALITVSKDPVPDPTTLTTSTSSSATSTTGPSMEDMFPALANSKKNQAINNNANTTRELTAEEAWDMDFA